MTMKVKLLRPLDGKPIGAFAEYPDADATDLAARGVVELVQEKAAQPPLNKMAPQPANKAVFSTRNKGR